MRKIAIVLGLIALSACEPYKDYYKLDEKYLARRQMETRRFDTLDEDKLLVAAAQVLQDMDYTIYETETKLGLITAYKERDAEGKSLNQGLAIAGAALSLLSGSIRANNATYDVKQKIWVSLVSTRDTKGKSHNVRVQFSRQIWNNQGESRIERLTDKKLYQEFFEKMSKSVFLAANDL